MQHDWNFYEAQVAARLTKGFLYRITELVNLHSSRQKNSLFSFSNRYGFSSHSDHSVAATASLKQLAVPVFHKHTQNNAYRGNLVEPIQCWLCWRFFDGRSNHDLSQSGKRSFYLFFFFLALNRLNLLLHSFNHSIIGLILLLLYRIIEGSTVREKRLEILAFRRQDLV